MPTAPESSELLVPPAVILDLHLASQCLPSLLCFVWELVCFRVLNFTSLVRFLLLLRVFCFHFIVIHHPLLPHFLLTVQAGPEKPTGLVHPGKSGRAIDKRLSSLRELRSKCLAVGSFRKLLSLP